MYENVDIYFSNFVSEKKIVRMDYFMWTYQSIDTMACT